MNVLSIVPSFVLAACLNQTVAGIDCYSYCAACWKIGSNSEDIRFSYEQSGACARNMPRRLRSYALCQEDPLHVSNQVHCLMANICVTKRFSNRCAIPDCGVQAYAVLIGFRLVQDGILAFRLALSRIICDQRITPRLL
jgi:hypothetical protein